MFWDRLARVTPPAVEALSLEAGKTHLNLQGIADHDANVTAFIADAVATFEGPRGIGVCLVNQTWRLSLDRWPAAIGIPLGPVSAVSSIKYQDVNDVEQTLAADQYVYDLDAKPLRIYPAEGVSWPSLKVKPGAIKVTFVAGFGAAASDVPGDIVGALKLIVGHRFANRTSDEIPGAAETVIARYRRGRLA